MFYYIRRYIDFTITKMSVINIFFLLKLHLQGLDLNNISVNVLQDVSMYPDSYQINTQGHRIDSQIQVLFVQKY